MDYNLDEYEFDFEDNRNTLPLRWHNLLAVMLQQMYLPDRLRVREFNTLELAIQGIKTKAHQMKIKPVLYQKIGSVYATVKSLILTFIRLMDPKEINVGDFWGIFYVRVWLSLASETRFETSLETLLRARQIAELFQRSMDSTDEDNEIRDCMLDLLEGLLNTFVEDIRFYRRHINDDETAADWLAFKPRLDPHLTLMDESMKRLHNTGVRGRKIEEWEMDFQKKQREQQSRTVNQPGVNFPCIYLPIRATEDFFFREDSLKKIAKHLDWHGSTGMRTYTIYGKRGIGKTQLALAFATQNVCEFDAIFWIACETAASLRQSFANVATALKLPGAQKGVNHEENVRLVHKWLADTDKYWLLIFDNAESEDLVRNHWPTSRGAILITSRDWTNFSLDAKRKGETVQPFDEKESWTYLLARLEKGQGLQEGTLRIDPEEESALKEIVKRLEGLPLGLRQLASTFTGYSSATVFLAKFEEAFRTLPPRQTGPRSPPVKALDTIWSMVYSSLTSNARHFLNVLCLFSPDRINLDLFLPSNQDAVLDYISFCRTGPRAGLGTLLELPDQLNAVLNELIDRLLIFRTGRHVQLHRVVAEAAIEFSSQNLPLAFASAVSLIHEAFPKQINGSHFTKVYDRCADVFTHADYISTRYSKLRQAADLRQSFEAAAAGQDPEFAASVSLEFAPPELSPPVQFAELLKNCAWYCYEVGAYNESFKLVEIAKGLVEHVPPGSEIYAHLLNTSGCCHLELNHLTDCNAAFETSYRIREKLLDNNGQEFASSIHNRGLIESSLNNWEKAIKRFERAESIRKNLNGEDVAISLAVTYLCMARCLVRLEKYDEANARLDAAEYLILREADQASQPMAFIYYIKGNMERRRNNPGEALKWYRKGLKVMNDLLPGHVCTSSLYYKKGCAEMELGFLDDAAGSLDKAQDLAEKSRTGINDGNVARILWKRSQLLAQPVPGFSVPDEQAKDLKVQAQIMRLQIGGSADFESEDTDPESEERRYDQLVCDFWRS